MAEIEVRERRKRPAPLPLRPALDRREADPPVALTMAAEKQGQTLAALSRMIYRPSGYLECFVRDGVPRALRAEEYTTLAAFFDVDERGLGIRQLWEPM